MPEAAGDRLTRLRRVDSQAKAARVLGAIEAMVGAGEVPRIAVLARRARVSRRFVYDHPELRAEAERRVAGMASCATGQMAASARVSAASLRADLEHARAKNRRLEADLSGLRRRLGQLLGQEAMAEITDADSRAVPGAVSARAEDLEQALFDAQEALGRRGEELEAARQINRELMARLNHP